MLKILWIKEWNTEICSLKALTILLENIDRTHIARQQKLAYAVITEIVLIIDIIFSA